MKHLVFDSLLALVALVAIAKCTSASDSRDQLSDVVRYCAEKDSTVYKVCEDFGIDTLQLENWVFCY